MKHQVVRLLCLVPLAVILLYFILNTKISIPSYYQHNHASSVSARSSSSHSASRSSSRSRSQKKAKSPKEPKKATVKPSPTADTSSPCKNGGVLFNDVCKCQIGWTGATCEEDSGESGGPWAPEVHIQNTFYDHQLPPLFLKAAGEPPAKSVLDIGCGLGLYLKGLWENGVTTCIGVEPSNMGKDERSPFHSGVCSLLQLDAFDPKADDVQLGRKYDMVLSLEVAEHVPIDRHKKYFNFLTRHADRVIIFSAAGLGQGGHGHISNRPPCEWIEEFRKRGWYLDPDASEELRKVSVFPWFRENLSVFRRRVPKDSETLKKILTLALPNLYHTLPLSNYTFPTFPEWKEMQALDKSEVEHEWKNRLQADLVLRKQEESDATTTEDGEDEEDEDDSESDGDDGDDDDESDEGDNDDQRDDVIDDEDEVPEKVQKPKKSQKNQKKKPEKQRQKKQKQKRKNQVQTR